MEKLDSNRTQLSCPTHGAVATHGQGALWISRCVVSVLPGEVHFLQQHIFFETHWVCPTVTCYCATLLSLLLWTATALCLKPAPASPFQKCDLDLPAANTTWGVQDAAASPSRSFWPLEKIAKNNRVVGICFSGRSVGIPKGQKAFPVVLYLQPPH